MRKLIPVAVLLGSLACGGGAAPTSRTSLGMACQTTDQGNASCDVANDSASCFAVGAGASDARQFTWHLCAVDCRFGCPAGSACWQGAICLATCAADSDCPQGSVCHPMDGGRCVPSCAAQPTGCDSGQMCQSTGHCTGWH